MSVIDMFGHRSGSTFKVGAAALIASLALSGYATAQTNVLGIGDSITFGTGSDADGVGVDDDLGGYRFYLDSLYQADALINANFIGNRNSGPGTTNNWSQPSAQAQNDRSFGGAANQNIPGMLRAFHNITADPSSDLSAFNPAAGTIDAILLHAGTNSVPGPTSTGNSGGQFGVSNAFNSMRNLLLAGTPGVSANVTGSPSFSTINNANGIHAQLSNSSVGSAESNVFVAGMIPLFNDFGLYSGALSVYNGTADYNSQVKNLIETDATLNDAASTVNYHYVDMFSITVAELDTAWLAGLFTGGNEADLIALISPELDAGVDYVDWGLGGVAEALFDEGTLTGTETNFTGLNTNIFADSVHPNNLGYAIMANVWYNATDSTFAVPEPSSMVLVLSGAGLLLARRRRRSA